jgi:ribosome-binding protein aMBF1 (putative translation factor)
LTAPRNRTQADRGAAKTGADREGQMIISLPPVDPEQLALGRRLRAVREARGVSAERLAGAARLSRADLALAEQGRLRLTATQLHGMIHALRIPLRLLFEGRDLTALRRF